MSYLAQIANKIDAEKESYEKEELETDKEEKPDYESEIRIRREPDERPVIKVKKGYIK